MERIHTVATYSIVEKQEEKHVSMLFPNIWKMQKSILIRSSDCNCVSNVAYTQHSKQRQLCCVILNVQHARTSTVAIFGEKVLQQEQHRDIFFFYCFFLCWRAQPPYSSIGWTNWVYLVHETPRLRGLENIIRAWWHWADALCCFFGLSPTGSHGPRPGHQTPAALSGLAPRGCLGLPIQDKVLQPFKILPWDTKR